jgi:S-adenosylmethionine hydrolase
MGCYLLRCAWSHLPPEAVILAVIDPGVGTARRAVAARVGSRLVVAPDNGLVTAPGQVDVVVELDSARMGLDTMSATFHGRDLFAPAAARLATGVEASALGTDLAPNALQPCPLPQPQVTQDGYLVTVLNVDRFGNVVTNLETRELPADACPRCDAFAIARRVRTYGEAGEGEVVVLEGSSRLLELALNRGSAAELLALQRGDTFELRF